MDAIAVVDDRENVRATLAARIRLRLEDLDVDWSVIEIGPLADMRDYVEWISDNDVRVLVLDQNLAEHIEGAEAVDYSGHQVAAFLRQRLPDLPQLIIASVTTDLEDVTGLDAVVQREQFNDHPAVYVERMVRMGRSYIERNEAELRDLTQISERIANDAATEEDRARLDAIRAKTQQSVDVELVSGIREWLQSAEDIRVELQEVLAQVRRGRG